MFKKEGKNMKRVLLLLFIISGTFSFAAQRVVVSEEFTATWCAYCPGAARGLEEIYKRTYDSVVVIAYHSSSSDPFYTPEAAARASYYSIPGYPTTWFDGVVADTGGLRYGTMYPFYRHRVTSRLSVPSPLEISLTCNYDTISNSGIVIATILNTSATPITGNLHFVIVENDIPYNWQGMTKLDFVMRDMLPDANGESVTIPANSSITKSRNFTIASSWNENNCKIVVFVQGANRQIYQGAEIGIIPKPKMEYYGINIQEVNGNNNGWAEPGEEIKMVVYGKNLGNGIFTGPVTLTTSDPYITIIGSAPVSFSIGPGDVDTVNISNFSISSNCPSPHLAKFAISFGLYTDSIPFLITTTPGFFDDMESGQGGWTHSGIPPAYYDNWHITEHKSHSPTHSWYSGLEGSWQYTNENDASLISPYFVVPPGVSLYFYHQYSLETNWDYVFVDIDNGSGWWKTLGEFTGTQAGWVQQSYPLNNYSGQTVRLRFRFVSDYSVVQEGWYIDDVYVPASTRITEKKENILPLTFTITPNPFITRARIKFYGNKLDGKPIFLKIYNISGNLVKSLSFEKEVIWNGDDNNGRALAGGIYFLEFENGKTKFIQKVIIAR